VVKNEERRMGNDVHIQCDACRDKVYLGREEKFEKLATGYYAIVARMLADEADRIVIRRRAAYVDEFARIEAWARGWRVYRVDATHEGVRDICPSCVPKGLTFLGDIVEREVQP